MRGGARRRRLSRASPARADSAIPRPSRPGRPVPLAVAMAALVTRRRGRHVSSPRATAGSAASRRAAPVAPPPSARSRSRAPLTRRCTPPSRPPYVVGATAIRAIAPRRAPPVVQPRARRHCRGRPQARPPRVRPGRSSAATRPRFSGAAAGARRSAAPPARSASRARCRPAREAAEQPEPDPRRDPAAVGSGAHSGDRRARRRRLREPPPPTRRSPLRPRARRIPRCERGSPSREERSDHGRARAPCASSAASPRCSRAASSWTSSTPSRREIAEDAGACAVMALERVPADIRRDGGVARMTRPRDDQRASRRRSRSR